MTLTADARIRSLRPPRTAADPNKAHAWLVESERRPSGRVEQALTVFAAGAECSFTCAFCDLWKWSIDGRTPSGSLTRQLRDVLDAVEGTQPDRLKFYNASNFFDTRAVPTEDVRGIAALARSFTGVTVESHANTIGSSIAAFASQLNGRLEVAMGLETVHPAAMSQINKRLDLARFDKAAEFLDRHEMDLRVFVLLGVPHVPEVETIAWTVRAVEYAAARGASVISIIPVRGGNGEMERLRELGQFIPPRLSHLEIALDACAPVASAVVTADLWDVDVLPACAHCRARRVDRMRRLNLNGGTEPRVVCNHCDGT